MLKRIFKMKTIIITVIALVLFTWCSEAQPIRWTDRSDRTFVYEITNREAEKLIKSSPKDSLILKMLHTPRGSFSGEWIEKPHQGHFIFAEIDKNKVNYRYVPVMPFQVFLFREYGVLTLQVVDAKGTIRDDAKVSIRGHWRLFSTGVPFDKTSHTYTINDDSEQTQRLLTVELDKYRAVFNLSKHIVNPWYGGNDYYREGPDFYSYLITDKNKYKPGESVRFKSYALSGSRSPLKSDLDIWMQTGRQNYRFKKIAPVSPYHPGGYAGEIVLHDSLKLKLDNRYTFQLRDKKGRIVASTNFKYEEYELYDSRLETRLSSYIQYAPNTNSIEIKALDANGLFLQDVRADVIVKRGNVSAVFTDVLQLPDTLMYKRVDLENDKSTFVEIPAGLFGESNCTYEVEVKALTYDNQALSSRQPAVFYQSSYNIGVSSRNDTICFQWEELGQAKNIRAEFWKNDSTEREIIELPHEEPFNQSVKQYHFRIDSLSFSQSVATSRLDTQLDIEGGIFTDSFNVKLVNPLKLELSWYIYQGNRLLEKGSGAEFDFSYPGTDLTLTHYVELFYFMGENEHSFRRTFVPKTDSLNVSIDLPARVYPGQTLDATIAVKDNWGKPVRDVDLTAFAYNSQLNYFVPDLPYYGVSPQRREQRSSYSIRDKNYALSVPLDYPYWNPKAQLDTLPYYQFTYPWKKIFRYAVDTPDSTTQVAPYVMKNGEAVAIYVIEINGRPVYFSWTEQPKRYSFLIPDTAKQQITFRLHDRAIVLDSLLFASGKKTILSLDLDYLPAGAQVIRLDTRDKYGHYHFTASEKKVYQTLISKLPVDPLYDFTYLKQGNTLYPVFHPCFQSPRAQVVAGPVPQDYMEYGKIRYRHEGGFSYEFEDNVVYKYPLDACPEVIRFSSSNSLSNLNDFALTPKVFNRMVADCRKEAPWYPGNIRISQFNLNLNFKLPPQPDVAGISNLLLRNVETQQILFPDRWVNQQRQYSSIPPAVYDVILLYDNGDLRCVDSLNVKPYTYTEVNLSHRSLQKRDSVSLKWLELRTRFIPAYTDSRPVGRPVESFIVRPVNRWNSVKGIIKDSTGEPLIGVTVMVKGTQNGTISNLDGYFEIAIDRNPATLVFSYLGFKHKELTVDMGSEVMVTLEEDVQMLDEVVVTGYGTSLKREMTGSLAGVMVRGMATLSSQEPPALQAPPEALEEKATSQVEIQAAEDRLYGELMQLNGLRSHFSDVGFWEPRLYTDRKGEAQFTVTFPDNITQWNTIVYAMNRKLKTGTARKTIQSYKPLMAELKTPQFLIVGDSSYYAGNIRNYTRDKEIAGQIVFVAGQDTTLNQDIRFTSSHQDKMPVHPLTLDSLTATYLFCRDDGYTDGERRTIPVLPQGTEIADGALQFLKSGDRKTIAAGDREEIHITLTSNPVDIYVDAAYALQSYRYDCNEQLASKLIGLLNYQLYQQYAGQPFKEDKRIREIIHRLLTHRNKDQLWSWWSNFSDTNLWMSAHVLRALNLARQAGYPVNLDVTSIEQDYMNVKRYRAVSLQDIEILNALSEAGTRQNYAAAIDFWDKEIARSEQLADSVARARHTKNTVSYLKEKLLLLEIRQRQHAGYSPDSLRRYLKKDVLGAVYCDDGIERKWYDNNLITTLIAYRIVRNDSTLQHLKEAMQMYILRTKEGYWNTYQASSAVMTVLPDLLTAADKQALSTVILSGKEQKEVTKFPCDILLSPGEQLTVEMKSGIPLIYSAYQLKRVTKEYIGDAFEIQTRLNADSLTAGEKTTLYVSVQVKQKNAEHVLIEVPIPAGCSYDSKAAFSAYIPQRGEFYREYFKDRVAIFCENLPVGTYEYRIELLPRYSGRYWLNPAKVEMMYFPVIHSTNGERTVRIE
ncbi:hypothetical protein FACS1894182_08650 [Bacteroidia bacterium]|nr:hypothetical protein FACS1894182_08650 [Bacteroidia bacterium]